jgi:hypothetical protein
MASAITFSPNVHIAAINHANTQELEETIFHFEDEELVGFEDEIFKALPSQVNINEVSIFPNYCH